MFTETCSPFWSSIGWADVNDGHCSQYDAGELREHGFAMIAAAAQALARSLAGQALPPGAIIEIEVSVSAARR